MKALIDYIILEELGISNDVIALTNKVKSTIGKDYAQNIGSNTSYNVTIPITSNVSVTGFERSIVVKFIDTDVNITYYVIDETLVKHSVIKTYLQKYNSNFNTKTNNLTLFLLGDGKKVLWQYSDATLQHEIEYWYQQHCKGDELLNTSHMKKYVFAQHLINSNDPIKRNIGFIYYYSEKIEHSAIMNGLYNKIMGTNALSMIEKPEDILKDYVHYSNIDTIRNDIISLDKDDKRKQMFVDTLSEINKSYDSFIKLANRTIDMYIKGFARTVYKAKKDLAEQYKNTIH
jgi:hypothetical protein